MSNNDRRPSEWHPSTIPPDEQRRWERAAAIGFGSVEPDDHWSVDQIEDLGRRAWAVEDAGVIVGTSADLVWHLTLPGGATMPLGAILAVTTRATHRRQGVLRSLMSAQLRAMATEGLAAAVLTASEGTIYGRFGFGVATSQHRLEAPVHGHGLDHVRPGRIELDAASVFRDEIVKFRRRSARHRPGTLERPEEWWDQLVLGDQVSFEGGGPQFVSLHRDDQGEVDGYALWRTEGLWGERTIVIRELHTIDPAVELALFRHCADIDLATSVRWDTAPADSPIPAATTDPRRCHVTGVRDQLWLCPLDVSALLAARTYGAPLDLTLRVDDHASGWSAPTIALRLTARPGEQAEVEVLDETPPSRSQDPQPDLVCDRTTLGMAVLGTTPWSTLVAAGRASVSNPAVARAADAAFASHPPANSQDYF